MTARAVDIEFTLGPIYQSLQKQKSMRELYRIKGQLYFYVARPLPVSHRFYYPTVSKHPSISTLSKHPSIFTLSKHPSIFTLYKHPLYLYPFETPLYFYPIETSLSLYPIETPFKSSIYLPCWNIPLSSTYLNTPPGPPRVGTRGKCPGARRFLEARVRSAIKF